MVLCIPIQAAEISFHAEVADYHAVICESLLGSMYAHTQVGTREGGCGKDMPCKTLSQLSCHVPWDSGRAFNLVCCLVCSVYRLPTQVQRRDSQKFESNLVHQPLPPGTTVLCHAPSAAAGSGLF
jgi:hypothetical protein